MFGYLVAAPELMTEPQLGRYRAAYCGLCRSLRARHGQISGLTLTYDMTFLVLFLSSLYEPEETNRGGHMRCAPFQGARMGQERGERLCSRHEPRPGVPEMHG